VPPVVQWIQSNAIALVCQQERMTLLNIQQLPCNSFRMFPIRFSNPLTVALFAVPATARQLPVHRMTVGAFRVEFAFLHLSNIYHLHYYVKCVMLTKLNHKRRLQ